MPACAPGSTTSLRGRRRPDRRLTDPVGPIQAATAVTSTLRIAAPHRDRGADLCVDAVMLHLLRRRRSVVFTAACAATALTCALSAASASATKPAPQGGWGVVGGPGAAAASNDNSAAMNRIDPQNLVAFRTAINKVEAMTNDGQLLQAAGRHGLSVLNVLWEDTGRFAGSSVGPNISDVTLQVREPINGGIRTHLLPVLRYPNFADKTADIPVDKLWIKVGNQSNGAQLVSVPLTEVLAHLREYLSVPDDVLGEGNLLAKTDTHFLASAQHVFVPIPKTGKAEFNPVIFNYQSAPGNPAVLTLLATREGTSVAVIENRGGDQSFQGAGQQLFFNNKGQQTVFTAERKSDVKARIEAGQATAADATAMDAGAEMLMLIQVPLKFKAPESRGYAGGGIGSASGSMQDGMALPAPSAMPQKKSAGAQAPAEVSDVENAIIGHGTDLGPVVEGNKLKLERDERFPVRVTVQFYKATSNGVVSDADLQLVKEQIDAVYAKGDHVGSLVVPEGARHRPTDWHLGKTPGATPMPTPTPTPADDPARPMMNDGASEKPSIWERFKIWWQDTTNPRDA